MKRIFLAVAVALFLSACGSAVKLDNVPVEDKSGTAVGTMPDTAATNGVGNGSMSSADLEKAKRDAFMNSTTRIVYFDYDSFVIRSEFLPVLEAHAKFLKANPAMRVSLEGNTDDRGGREYNLALGQKRAEAVRTALARLGVADSQMEAVSFGKEKPAVAGNSEEAMSKNRRTEINYR
jgi:peptidoglycan-associated lipoprotein